MSKMYGILWGKRLTWPVTWPAIWPAIWFGHMAGHIWPAKWPAIWPATYTGGRRNKKCLVPGRYSFLIFWLTSRLQDLRNADQTEYLVIFLSFQDSAGRERESCVFLITSVASYVENIPELASQYLDFLS